MPKARSVSYIVALCMRLPFGARWKARQAHAGLLEDDEDGSGIEKAIEAFKDVANMEQHRGEWGFKANKMQVKLHHRLGNADNVIDAYSRMLQYVKCVTLPNCSSREHNALIVLVRTSTVDYHLCREGAVTKNYSEKVVTNLLELISSSKDNTLLERFYNTTLNALEDAKNQRLWFRTNMKLCHLYLQMQDFSRLESLLNELHRSCLTADGKEDHNKGTELLEIFSVQIRMFTEQNDTNKLKELYQRALGIKGAIPHPRVMGIIRECGGKMHMSQRAWNDAATDFFEAFKGYDEAGEKRKVQCLKYLVLAYMLMETDVDPFQAQETKAHRNDPEVQAMTSLVSAYQESNISEFERILRTKKSSIMGDPFIKQYIEDLLKKIRTHVLLDLVKPYTYISLDFAASELRITTPEAEHLIHNLILDGRVRGAINKAQNVLELEGEESENAQLFGALQKWTKQLETFRSQLTAKVS